MLATRLIAAALTATASAAIAEDIITVAPFDPPPLVAQGSAPFAAGGVGGSRFQQVYSADFFGVEQLLNGLAFRSSATVLGDTTYDNVVIRLSTTGFGDEAGTPLTGDFDANAGSDATIVYAGALTFAAPIAPGFGYAVNFTTGFNYNPAFGNLLLEVVVAAGSGISGPGALFDIAEVGGDGIFSVAAMSDGNAASGTASTAGVITQFSGTTGDGMEVDLPEPATWALMVGGFGFVGASMRRRRGAAAG